jgi:hypothetical protein
MAIAAGTGAEPAVVIPGTYNIVFGTVYGAKEKRYPLAVLLPGKAEASDVQPDKTQRLDLGAPFQLQFAATKADNKITIKPDSVHLYGKAGEEYVQIRYKTGPTLALVNGSKTIVLGKMSYG